MKSRFIKRTLPHILVGLTFLAPRAVAQCPGDSDGDCLDDALEQTLLDRHRPILVFEDDERHWPISAWTFVRNSRLRWNTHPDGNFEYGWLTDVYSKAQLAADPELILNGINTRYKVSSNAKDHPTRAEWYLDLDDNLRAGFYPGPDGSGHQGMYGHVVPLADGSITLGRGPRRATGAPLKDAANSDA